jgi:pyridoxal 5'-phosphate synthase pdxS subunit
MDTLWSDQEIQARLRLKTGLAEMLKRGVIMDVTNAQQAKIAEEAGAVAVMALERIPADIRAHGGVARMSSPAMIKAIQDAVSIPVMAKCRIGHFAEAQILEALGVDFVDESEVLTPADEKNHIDKHAFKVPFVCGCRDLGEALRRIGEGAAMIRTKGEAGSGNIVEAARRRRADDATRRGVGLRRQRHLQERRSQAARGGDRPGGHLPRRSGQAARDLAGAGRGHARPGDRGDPRGPAPGGARLVTARAGVAKGPR